MKYSSTSRRRKLLPVILGLVVIVVGASFLLYNLLNKAADKSVVMPETDNSVDLSAPTEEELKETENHKQSLSNDKQNSDSGGQMSSGVTPIITSADQSTVRAFISGISEDGGVCTATFSQGVNTFSKQSSGFRDVNSTVCEPINLVRADFVTAGEWTVTLSYRSSLVEGKSQEVKFNVM